MKVCPYPFNTLLFLALVLSMIKGFAQTNHRFAQLSVKDGLLSDQSFSIMEDSLGYIWIGTLGGIQRYDGYELVNFISTYEAQNHKASFVRDIKLKGPDTLLFADRGNGIGRIIKGKLDRPLLVDDGLSSNLVECLLIDEQKGIWAGTIDAGLNYIKNGSITKFRHDTNNPNSLSSDEIYSLLEDRNGNIWVGTTKGINLYLGNDTFKRFSHDPNNNASLSHNFVHALHQDPQGVIWAGTVDGGLNKFVSKDSTFVSFKNEKDNPYSISNNVVLAIDDADNGSLWIGTWGGGLNYFDGNKFYHYKHDPQNKLSISSNNIEDIMTDSDGDLWIATYQGGVNKYSKQQFNTYAFSHYKDEGMIQSPISSLSTSIDGNLWIATNNGINKFIEKTNKKTIEKYQVPQMGLVSNDIHKILEDSQGRLWIGMIGSGRGLQVIDKGVTKHFYYLENDSTSISNDFIESILEDSKKNIWIGTRNGLNLYLNGKFKRFESGTSDLPNNQIRGISEGNNGSLWIATYGGGLSRLKGNKFTNYTHDPLDSSSFPESNLWDVEPGKQDDVWVATRSSLFNFKPKSRKVAKYAKNEGITSIIEDIVVDSQKNVWVATHDGLLLYDSDADKFESFTTNDGLAGNQINTIIEGEKYIYIGGSGGFSTIAKDSIWQKKANENLRYSRLEILTNNYQNLDPNLSEAAMITDQHVILPYNINNFIVHFAMLDHEINPSHQYQYRIDNLTDEWLFNGKSNKISFTGLPPGDYVLKVKSLNKEDTIVLPITINPPIWKTHTAFILYLLIFGGILFSFYYLRLKRRKLRYELEFSELSRNKDNELNQEKLKFFTNVSHELRTPLTLILAPLQDLIDENLSEKVKEKLNFINQSSSKLLQLTNQLLDFRKTTNQEMILQAVNQDLVSFVKNSISVFDDKAEKVGVEFNFNSSLTSAMVFFDSSKMESVISNLLSNAFKSTNGKINVEITHHGNPMMDAVISSSGEILKNYVEVFINDNGTGINQKNIEYIFNRFYQAKINSIDSIGSGIGLALAKDFVYLHQGTLSVNSVPNVKTSFYFKLPFGSAHLSVEQIVAKSDLSDMTSRGIFNVSDPEPIHSVKSKVKHSQKILLVEDDASLSEYLTSVLSDFYTVITAKNGKEGLEQCAKNDFNLIISDVMMNEMDGVTFCKKIKTNSDTDYIPIILLTARSLEEQQLEGLKAGANDYIIKPFNIKTLRIKIDNLLSIQYSMHKLYHNMLIDKETSDANQLSPERDFIKEVIALIELNLSNENFGVNELASALNISRSNLYKKTKFLTGKSVIGIIIDIRLKKALSLICGSNERISEIAYKVGFNDAKYFRICFKKQFGSAPQKYRQENFQKKI